MDSGSQLDKLLMEGKSVLAIRYAPNGVMGPPLVKACAFASWRTKVLIFLDTLPKDTVNRYIKEVESRDKDFFGNAIAIQSTLKGIKESIADGMISCAVEANTGCLSDLGKIKLLCFRFHKVARSLRNRHAGRDSLIIKDEYDVQDLFGSLLRLFF